VCSVLNIRLLYLELRSFVANNKFTIPTSTAKIPILEQRHNSKGKDLPLGAAPVCSRNASLFVLGNNNRFIHATELGSEACPLARPGGGKELGEHR
jgi:hypothetical protein